MQSLLKISEAASLGLHTVLVLAQNKDGLMSNGQIAKTLGVSENHLSKVLQRLARVGIVKSTRGPRGGFTIGKKIEEITLLDVYEAIDGPVSTDECLLSRPICGGGKSCILGGLLSEVNLQVKQRLSSVRISDI